jgi:hypothetical protein
VKETPNINLNTWKDSREDSSVQGHREGKGLVTKVSNDERAVIREDESPGLLRVELDLNCDKEHTGSAIPTDVPRRSGRNKRMRTDSSAEDAGSDRAKRTKIGGQGKMTPIPISSHVDKGARGESIRRSRRTKESSRGKGPKMGMAG